MAEDVQSEITLDDFNADEQDTAKTESSTVKSEAKAEEKPEVAKDTKEVVKGDDTPTSPEVPTKTDTEDKVDETVEDKPLSETKNQVAEKRKTELNTEIRDLVARRNALKTEVEKANAEVYQPATEDELVEQGLNATDAKVEALRQRIEMSDYNARVTDAQLTLSSESERVLSDFPIFNSDSTEYDEELANEAAELLKANLIYDPNTNQVIGSNVSTYQLYKTLARASGISVAKGQIKGRQDTEKMLANVDTPSSAAPPIKTEDPLLALWKSDD